MIYELWESADEIILVSYDHPMIGEITKGFEKLLIIEADSWENICKIRDKYLKWEPKYSEN